MITFDDVQAAARRLDGVAHRTPVITSGALDEATGAGRVLLKAENLQRVGAFKFRGAYNAVSTLSPEDRRRGVATVSSGNHAQAVSLAARLHEIPAVILMPEDAPPASSPRRAATAPRSCPSTATASCARNCWRSWSPSAASRRSIRTTTRT